VQIVIVGAGTFGASLAWTLARAGEDVVLVDQFEPGDARATSGGESRLIRCGHGADELYTASARRARGLWRELEAETGEELMVEIGMAWFAQHEDGWEAESERAMASQGIPCERLDVAEGAKLFPSLGTDDLAFVLYEPEAGVLRAQRAVQALARQAVAHGAKLVRGRAVPDGDTAVIAAGGAGAATGGAAAGGAAGGAATGRAAAGGPAGGAATGGPAAGGPAGGTATGAATGGAAAGGAAGGAAPGARLFDRGRRLEGDAVVWACGPWLGRLFGDLVPLTVTRQELLFFDGGPAWRSPGVPGWVDYDLAMYGTGDLDELGVKVALDREGPPLDPDDELPAAGATEPEVRGYLARRFPALADAPLSEGRCCRYELSADSNFIAARHPEHSRTWIVGGGSGHGFKHGPALAERVADALRTGEPLPGRFGLGRRAAGRSFRTAGSGVR
jgi:sarcosine oxidase